MNVFERQFDEENGERVYRRYGKGAAYRVNDDEYSTMVTDYLDEYRKNYIITILLMVLMLGSIIAVTMVTETDPVSASIWWMMTIPIVLITFWFGWANHRAVVRPDQRLSRNTPIASALSTGDAKRKGLSQISYANLASAPFFGLLLVLVVSTEFDIWEGPGRVVWLVPISFTMLAVVQAYRKFKANRP